MPPEGDPLTEQQIATLRAWIDSGAPAPPEGVAIEVDHWSFQKPVRPEIPAVKDAAWSANPIDAFIAAKHEDLGLTPLAEAPPNVLLRRVYLDLVGLPPTPQELEEFLASVPPSPTPPLSHSSEERARGRGGAREKAYQAVVDKLLASPHYGERWGRHWMDVWRYSDWDGYGNEVRESQPHIWRWRDWIVESLNEDRSYAAMIEEMLAADELAPDDADALRATGYLARSWYKFNRNKWLDDAVEHTGKAFLGLTFNCARCHDHMYDPLSQREYYELRAFLEPYDVRTDRLPGEADTAKQGLARVFDAKAETPTFLFIRGNEKEPQKDEPLSPAVPAVLKTVPCSIEPVTLPPVAAYPGLAGFIREEALAAARAEVEQAKAALAEAEKKFAEALSEKSDSQASEPPPSPEPPDPSPSVVDADAQLAVARAALAAAEANLAFNEARIAADDANYAAPPAPNAEELSLAAGRLERLLNFHRAEKALHDAEIKLTAAQRAKKDGDDKTAKAVTDAEAAGATARKARGTAWEALDQPHENYSRFTPTYPATSTGRRAALARWIASKESPLTARVAVNHIWLRHFGTPLVPSVFDFGMNGKPPTNQPLLDWLAVELMDSEWQMKHVHRLIVTSKTYRLGSGFRVQGSEEKERESGVEGRESVPQSNLNPAPRTLNTSIDPENLHYWRFTPRRAEAEIVRDATLHVAGSLDVTRGGPELDQAAGLTVPRRSIYFRASKEKKMEFLSLFDSANPVECYRRSESIAPQQALAMANSTLTLAQARILAKKLTDSQGNVAVEEAPRRFVEDAFVRILCRQPSDEELTTCLGFLSEQAAALADTAALTAFSSGPEASVPPSSDPQQRARENLVHVLLNHHEFVTVR
jgi:hypothetical protein